MVAARLFRRTGGGTVPPPQRRKGACGTLLTYSLLPFPFYLRFVARQFRRAGRNRRGFPARGFAWRNPGQTSSFLLPPFFIAGALGARFLHAPVDSGAGFRLCETLAKLPPSSFLPPPFFNRGCRPVPPPIFIPPQGNCGGAGTAPFCYPGMIPGAIAT